MIGQGTFKISNLSFCICKTVKSSVILNTTGAIFKERVIMELGMVLQLFLNIETGLPMMTGFFKENVPYKLIMEVE